MVAIIQKAAETFLAVEVDRETIENDAQIRKQDLLKFKEMMSLDPKCKSRKFAIVRRISPKEAGQVSEMIKKLDSGNGLEIHKKLTAMALKKRITV